MLSLHAALMAMVLSGAGQTVLLDFYSDTCPPCQAMNPVVRDLASKGYLIRKVNVQHERALSQQFGVTNIPCFVMVVDGREVDRMVGKTSMARLEQMCRLGIRSGPAAKAPALLARDAAEKPGASIPVPDGWNSPAPANRAGAAIRPAVATAGDSAHTRAVPVNWTSPGSAPADAEAALIAATVRLRVEDRDGHSCGSGTIIDTRQGEALILTCGHIFRDSKGKGRIEVDLFGSNAPVQVAGRLICYDLTRDVALVSVRPPNPVAAARVAPPGYRPRPGDAVISVGCNNGATPTAQRSQVTAVDKFQGPANSNVSVAGQPVEGRSGGGLFSAEGLVIGVCYAADPSDREGLFAGPGSIHSELDRANLSCIYQPDANAAAPRAVVLSEPARTPRAPAKTAPDIFAAGPALGVPAGQPPLQTAEPPKLNPGEQAALDEIRQRAREGAEVVCIVRDRRDPQAKSEVIMIDKASPALVQQLDQMAAQSRAPQARYETSLEIPRPRKPILEWDAQRGWLHRESMPAAK